MMWLVPLLSSMFLAHAAPTGPAWVTVDRGAWLHTAPHADAVRLRPDDVDAAPPHTATPIMVLQFVRKGTEYTEVRTVSTPLAMTPDWQAKAPDLTPTSWPHCYPPPTAIAQLSASFWVRNEDILPVLIKPVTVNNPDGSAITLQPGVAVTGGSDLVRRVRAHHLEMTVPVPPDAIGSSYSLDGVREVPPRMDMVRPDGSVEPAHPQLRLRLKAHEKKIETRTPEIPTAKDGTVSKLVDRCATVTFAEPLTQLPVDEGDDTVRWPLFAPESSVITLSSGEILGTVSASDMPLWSRKTCSWSKATGMCCTPPKGLEMSMPEGEVPGVCYLADPPEARRSGGLRSIISDQADAHSEFVAAFGDGSRSISWSVDDITGDLTLSDLTESITPFEGLFDHCYLLGLQVTPTMRGNLDTTISIMPNGQVRYAKGVWDVPPPHENDRTAPCVERTLSKITVLNAIGQPPSTAVVRISMTR